jgi:hypothetical protein
MIELNVTYRLILGNTGWKTAAAIGGGGGGVGPEKRSYKADLHGYKTQGNKKEKGTRVIFVFSFFLPC